MFAQAVSKSSQSPPLPSKSEFNIIDSPSHSLYENENLSMAGASNIELKCSERFVSYIGSTASEQIPLIGMNSCVASVLKDDHTEFGMLNNIIIPNYSPRNTACVGGSSPTKLARPSPPLRPANIPNSKPPHASNTRLLLPPTSVQLPHNLVSSSSQHTKSGGLRSLKQARLERKTTHNHQNPILDKNTQEFSAVPMDSDQFESMSQTSIISKPLPSSNELQHRTPFELTPMYSVNNEMFNPNDAPKKHDSFSMLQHNNPPKLAVSPLSSAPHYPLPSLIRNRLESCTTKLLPLIHAELLGNSSPTENLEGHWGRLSGLIREVGRLHAQPVEEGEETFEVEESLKSVFSTLSALWDACIVALLEISQKDPQFTDILHMWMPSGPRSLIAATLSSHLNLTHALETVALRLLSCLDMAVEIIDGIGYENLLNEENLIFLWEMTTIVCWSQDLKAQDEKEQTPPAASTPGLPLCALSTGRLLGNVALKILHPSNMTMTAVLFLKTIFACPPPKRSNSSKGKAGGATSAGVSGSSSLPPQVVDFVIEEKRVATQQKVLYTATQWYRNAIILLQSLASCLRTAASFNPSTTTSSKRVLRVTEQIYKPLSEVLQLWRNRWALFGDGSALRLSSAEAMMLLESGNTFRSVVDQLLAGLCLPPTNAQSSSALMLVFATLQELESKINSGITSVGTITPLPKKGNTTFNFGIFNNRSEEHTKPTSNEPKLSIPQASLSHNYQQKQQQQVSNHAPPPRLLSHHPTPDTRPITPSVMPSRSAPLTGGSHIMRATRPPSPPGKGADGENHFEVQSVAGILSPPAEMSLFNGENNTETHNDINIVSKSDGNDYRNNYMTPQIPQVLKTNTPSSVFPSNPPTILHAVRDSLQRLPLSPVSTVRHHPLSDSSPPPPKTSTLLPLPHRPLPTADQVLSGRRPSLPAALTSKPSAPPSRLQPIPTHKRHSVGNLPLHPLPVVSFLLTAGIDVVRDATQRLHDAIKEAGQALHSSENFLSPRSANSVTSPVSGLLLAVSALSSTLKFEDSSCLAFILASATSHKSKLPSSSTLFLDATSISPQVLEIVNHARLGGRKVLRVLREMLIEAYDSDDESNGSREVILNILEIISVLLSIVASHSQIAAKPLIKLFASPLLSLCAGETRQVAAKLLWKLTTLPISVDSKVGVPFRWLSVWEQLSTSSCVQAISMGSEDSGGLQVEQKDSLIDLRTVHHDDGATSIASPPRGNVGDDEILLFEKVMKTHTLMSVVLLWLSDVIKRLNPDSNSNRIDKRAFVNEEGDDEDGTHYNIDFSEENARIVMPLVCSAATDARFSVSFFERVMQRAGFDINRDERPPSPQLLAKALMKKLVNFTVQE